VISSVPLTEVYKQVYAQPGYSYEAAKGTGMWVAGSGTALLLIAGGIQARAWLPRLQESRRGSAADPETRRATATTQDRGAKDASSWPARDPGQRRRSPR
jgi:hypothetical protein